MDMKVKTGSMKDNDMASMQMKDRIMTKPTSPYGDGMMYFGGKGKKSGFRGNQPACEKNDQDAKNLGAGNRG